MINRRLSRALRFASLLAALASCAPAAASVAGVPAADLSTRARHVFSGEEPAAIGQPVLMAAGDCSEAAAQAAADSGGQVLSVSSRQQDGKTVCVVTVLVPGSDGGRPRKRTITLPQ